MTLGCALDVVWAWSGSGMWSGCGLSVVWVWSGLGLDVVWDMVWIGSGCVLGVVWDVKLAHRPKSVQLPNRLQNATALHTHVINSSCEEILGWS